MKPLAHGVARTITTADGEEIEIDAALAGKLDEFAAMVVTLQRAAHATRKVQGLGRENGKTLVPVDAPAQRDALFLSWHLFHASAAEEVHSETREIIDAHVGLFRRGDSSTESWAFTFELRAMRKMISMGELVWTDDAGRYHRDRITESSCRGVLEQELRTLRATVPAGSLPEAIRQPQPARVAAAAKVACTLGRADGNRKKRDKQGRPISSGRPISAWGLTHAVCKALGVVGLPEKRANAERPSRRK